MNLKNIGLIAASITALAIGACDNTATSAPTQTKTVSKSACDTPDLKAPGTATEKLMEKVVVDSAADMKSVLHATLSRNESGTLGYDTWMGNYCDSDKHTGLTVVVYHNLYPQEWTDMSVGPDCRQVKPATGYRNTLSTTCTTSPLQVDAMAKVDLPGSGDKPHNYVLSLRFGSTPGTSLTTAALAVAAKQVQQLAHS